MTVGQAVLKLWSGHETIVNTQRAITPKVENPELRFMCSARRLMVFNICVKFHENMSSGFKVMERTRKLLTDTHTHTHTHTQKRRKHYTPIAYFVCLGYNKGLQFVSHILILKGIWAFICYLYFTSHLTFKQKLCHYCQQKKGQHQNKFFLAFNIKETQ